jgi:hypothetical protein
MDQNENRPWYLSLTAIWEDATLGCDQLFNLCERYSGFIPPYQLLVNRKHWHFTVLPLVRIVEFSSTASCEEYSRSLLVQLQRMWNHKKEVFPLLNVEAYEVISYNTGTAVQFTSKDDSLSILRRRFREIISTHINDLIDKTKGTFTELLPENIKNSGNKAYGSIARAATEENKRIRWRREFETAINMTFEKVYLLVSDESLSNPYAHTDANRTLIRLGKQVEKEPDHDRGKQTD